MFSHARPIVLPLFRFAAGLFLSHTWRLREARRRKENVVLLRGLVLGIIEVVAQRSRDGCLANPRSELPVWSNAAHENR